MNFRYQGTCGVENRQSQCGGFVLDGAGDAMGAKNDNTAFGSFLKAIDEDNALLFKAVHDRAVMHDLFADINRVREFLQGDIDDVDRADDTGTETTRANQDDFHGRIITKTRTED